jgi:hypothetical protein
MLLCGCDPPLGVAVPEVLAMVPVPGEVYAVTGVAPAAGTAGTFPTGLPVVPSSAEHAGLTVTA